MIDVNPFGIPSCPLLFEWDDFPLLMRDLTGAIDETGTSASPHPEFRIVRSSSEVLQSSSGASRGPVDVHLARDFPNFMAMAKQQSREKDDSCSDEDDN